jgi:hypothetical protein
MATTNAANSLILVGAVRFGLDRSRARSAVGGGFPSPPFRMRGGVTFPPWPTFPEASFFIPDGRISRVRLATMTFRCSLPNAPRWLKRSPAYTRATPVYCNARYACTVVPLIRHKILMGAQNVPAMAESRFAPSRRYLVGSSVTRHLGQQLPGPHRSY